MKKILSICWLMSVMNMTMAQENRTSLIIDGVAIQNKAEVDAAQVQNICALQLSNPDWQVQITPKAFQLVISSKGKMVSGYCRQGGTLPDKVLKALAALQKGDVIFLADFNIAESAKQQVGQIGLTIK